METVAFNPLPDPSRRTLVLTSAWGLRNQPISGADHRELIGDRLQDLINLCPDPKEAVRRLSQDLEELDLWRQGNPPVSQAARDLVVDNPYLIGRLDQLNALPLQYKDLRVVPSNSVSELLLVEKFSPERSLRQWADQLKL